MDFRKIEYFLKVADTMNISRAAEELHITHQGLSKQIRLLEEELGAALLERIPGGIVLTESGKKMNEWFRPIASEANYRYRKLREFIEEKKSSIQLGYFNALSYRECVKPVLEFFQQEQTRVNVEVLAADIGQVRKLLYSDVIDLAITVMMDSREWEEVSYSVLAEYPLKIIVSENHPWFQKDTVQEEELAEGSLLYYAEGSASFVDQMKVKACIPAPNFDSYIGRLYEGREFGLIADIYSRREGNFRLLDLPKNRRLSTWMIAAFRKEHPLRHLFEAIPVQESES